MLGVAPSSVKRWADEGALPCVKTAGRHRRFAAGDVDRFLALQSDTGHGRPGEARRWVEMMVNPEPYLLIAGLFNGRAHRGSWSTVADEVAQGLIELGRRWQSGKIDVLQEHAASERIHRALAQVASGLSVDPAAPRCLLVAAEEEEHTLGLSLAELCLREAGWNTIWAGRRVPRSNLLAQIGSGGVSMVAISASSFSKRRSLTDLAAEVGAACARRKIPLVLGGAGIWPKRVAGTTRLHSFHALHRFAVSIQRRVS